MSKLHKIQTVQLRKDRSMIDKFGEKAIEILYTFAPFWFVVASGGIALVLYSFGVRP